jgi:hypothetical protein
MIDTDLTSISTFGWFQEKSIIEDLTPISTFGWWFDLGDIVENPDIINFILFVNKTIEFNFER